MAKKKWYLPLKWPSPEKDCLNLQNLSPPGLKDLNDGGWCFKSLSQGTKVNTRGNTIANIPSNENFKAVENIDDKQLPDEIIQLSAEKFVKFNFTPKMNPRLKKIKEQELKYTPNSM